MRGPSAVESVWLGSPPFVDTSRGTGTAGRGSLQMQERTVLEFQRGRVLGGDWQS